jgi:hypothetical protein
MFIIKNGFYYIMVLKLLELFSGTGSVGKVAESIGYDVVSLDRDMEEIWKQQYKPIL